MNHNRFSNFHSIYTIIQVVFTDYLAFKSSSKMIQEEAVASIIIVLISEKTNSRKKRKEREEPLWNLGLKQKKLNTLWIPACRMRLEDEYNYNILLRMTSQNFEKMFQLIKDDINKENTKIRKLIQTITFSHNWLFTNRRIIRELCLWVLIFLLNYEQFSIYFFLWFHLLHFSSPIKKANQLI